MVDIYRGRYIPWYIERAKSLYSRDFSKRARQLKLTQIDVYFRTLIPNQPHDRVKMIDNLLFFKFKFLLVFMFYRNAHWNFYFKADYAELYVIN